MQTAFPMTQRKGFFPPFICLCSFPLCPGYSRGPRWDYGTGPVGHPWGSEHLESQSWVQVQKGGRQGRAAWSAWSQPTTALRHPPLWAGQCLSPEARTRPRGSRAKRPRPCAVPVLPTPPPTLQVPWGSGMSGRNGTGIHWVTAGEGALSKSILS